MIVQVVMQIAIFMRAFVHMRACVCVCVYGVIMYNGINL